MHNYTLRPGEQTHKPTSCGAHPDHLKVKLKVTVVGSFTSAQFLTFSILDEAAIEKSVLYYLALIY